MAKRIQISQHGDVDVLEYVDFEPSAPEANQVQIRNHALGLNFIDTYYRSGLYSPPSLPSGLGTEGAGEVIAIGDSVTHCKVGDRVAYCTGPLGAYSEIHTLAESHVLHLPNDISFEQAAACLLKGLTTQYLLCQTYPVKEGDIILFHAAAGGVGSIACQWAKAIGAKLIGTAGSTAKIERAKALGAWQVINYHEEDVVQRVKELTNNAKCPVVYDSVGKDMWERSLDCLAPRGLMVSFGNSSGAVTGVNLGILNQKGGLYVTRPSLAWYANSHEKLQAMANELFDLISSKKIIIDINQRFPLTDAAKAQQQLTARKTVGSTVLLV